MSKTTPPKFLKADNWIFHTEYPVIIFLVADELKVYQVKDPAEDFLIERTLILAQNWYDRNYVNKTYRL
jgi:hypothetical protein